MKYYYKLILTASVILLLFWNIKTAQGTTYYSKGSSPTYYANVTTSWAINQNGTGDSPPNFTSGDIFIIQNGHTMGTNDVWSISGTGSKLAIANGGILESLYQITLSGATTFQILNGGKYIHNYSVGTLQNEPPPSVFNGIESFQSNSTVEIKNWDWSNGNKIADFPGNITWGNLVISWNPTTAGTNWNFKSSLTYIQGNFTYDVLGATTYFTSLAVGGSPLELTIEGNFNIYNGKLQFASTPQSSTPGYKLNLYGNYNQTGGVFDHFQNQQPLEFNFYGTNNKIFNHSGGNLTNTNINWVIKGDASYILNSNLPVATTRSLLIESTGLLDCALNSVTGEGVFTIQQNGTLKTAHSNGVDGSIAVSGNKVFNTLSNYVFYGNLNQNSGNIPSTIRDFTIDKNNGSGVTLSKNISVRNNLNMLEGKIRTGNYTIILGTSTNFLGYLNYISGRIIGKFARWFNNEISSFKLFPIGTENFNRQVDIRFSTAPDFGGSLTVEHFDMDPGNYNNIPYILDYDENNNEYYIKTYSKKGYWEITNDDELSGGKYDICLKMEGIVGANNPPHLRVIKRKKFDSEWTVDGYHENGEGPCDYPTVKRTGLSGFSQFGIGGNADDENPLEGGLPVKLSSFTYAIMNRNVNLHWTTEFEENNSGFEIQKTEYRKQNSEWTNIGFVKGKGNSNGPASYSFEYKNLQTGKYKYRLKQIDYNGNFEYFELADMVEIGIPSKYDLSQNYPNPFNPVTKINFALPESGLVTLKVYDMLGKEIATVLNEVKEAGYYTITFDVRYGGSSKELSSGVYFYRLSVNGFSSVKRLVILK